MLFDADDKRLIAQAGLAAVALLLGSLTLAVALGLAVRIFVWIAGA